MNHSQIQFSFYFWLIFLICACGSVKAQAGKFDLNLESVRGVELATVFYDACAKDRAYVIDQSAIKLETTSSMKVRGFDCAKMKFFLDDTFEGLGLVVIKKQSFDLITAKKSTDEPATEFVYFPKHRDAGELAEIAGVIIKRGRFSHTRKPILSSESTVTQGVSTTDNGSNGASVTNRPLDRLVYSGPLSELQALKTFLDRVDTPQPQITLHAAIYEVSSDDKKGSAIQAALKLLNSKFNVQLGSNLGSDFLSFKSNALEAVFSVLDTDRRFKYIASPRLIVTDNAAARFFAGQDVRVDGAIVLDRSGNPVRSKENLSAGISLDAKARIRAETIETEIKQTLSTFAASGSADPSILRRELSTKLHMLPGHVYVVGGLTSKQNTFDASRFFGFKTSEANFASENEVLIILRAVRDDQSGS
jgi:general secretion pathway protein D